MSRRWEGDPGPAGAPDGDSPASPTAEEADALLAGGPGPAGTEELARLLAVLAGPAEARPEELAGYEAVRPAFVAAGETVRRPSRRGRVARIGIAVAALSVAGMGTAAAANTLPTPLQRLAHDVFGGIGVPAPSDARSDSAPSSAAVPRPTGVAARTAVAPSSASSASSASSPQSTTPEAGASPEDIVLCRTYTQDGDARSLTADQQAQLAELAGGKQHIAKYCKAVLAADKTTSAASGAASVSTTTDKGKGKDNGNANGGGNGNGKAKGHHKA